VVPDAARRSVYDDAYATWRALGDAVTETSHRLARRPREVNTE